MAIYPTWNRFLKLWKTIIYPTIKQNVKVIGSERVTHDEEYLLTIDRPVDEALIIELIDKIKYALEAAGYEVDKWDRNDDSDLTIQGKNHDLWAPCVDISLYEYTLEDDLILDWDDERWNNAGTDFQESYKQWLIDNNAKDNYENIWDAPRKIQKLYCEWVRSQDEGNRFYVDITPVNM